MYSFFSPQQFSKNPKTNAGGRTGKKITARGTGVA
jgi:hypothetical protein